MPVYTPSTSMDDYYKKYFGSAYYPMKALVGVQDFFEGLTTAPASTTNQNWEIVPAGGQTYVPPTTTIKPQISFGDILAQNQKAEAEKIANEKTTRLTGLQPNYTQLADALGGQPPNPNDINPNTGEKYATNPTTGEYDENWFYNAFMPALQTKFADLATKRLYDINRGSNISEQAISTQATSELTKYYNDKLTEAQGDVNKAMGLLEEDYKTGKRRYSETADVSMKTSLEQAPQELLSTLEDLNRRGLLQTRTVEGAPDLTAKLSTGETITAQKPTVAGFGGLAGKVLGRVTSGQRTRAQVIAKTLADQLADLGTETQRQTGQLRTNFEKLQKQTTEQKAQDIATLTAQRYAKALEQQNLKAKEALGPYLGRYA